VSPSAIAYSLAVETLLLGTNAGHDVLELDELLLLGQLCDSLVADLHPLDLGGQISLDFVELANAVVQVVGHLLNVGLTLLHRLDLVADGLRPHRAREIIQSSTTRQQQEESTYQSNLSSVVSHLLDLEDGLASDGAGRSRWQRQGRGDVSGGIVEHSRVGDV